MGEDGVIGYTFLLSEGHRKKKSSEAVKVWGMEGEGANVESRVEGKWVKDVSLARSVSSSLACSDPFY